MEGAWPEFGAAVCVVAVASSSLPPKLVMKVIFSGPGERERDRDSELDSDSGLKDIRKKEKQTETEKSGLKTQTNQDTGKDKTVGLTHLL